MNKSSDAFSQLKMWKFCRGGKNEKTENPA